MMKHDEIGTLTAENTVLKNRIKELELLLKHYEERFRLSQKKRFGTSSEKSAYDRICMELEEMKTTLLEQEEARAETQTVAEHSRKRRTRAELLPENLPVEEILCELPVMERNCPECGEVLRAIGHECRRELVVIPAKAIIRNYKAAVYVCRGCEEASEHTPVIKAKIPKPVITPSATLGVGQLRFP